MKPFKIYCWEQSTSSFFLNNYVDKIIPLFKSDFEDDQTIVVYYLRDEKYYFRLLINQDTREDLVIQSIKFRMMQGGVSLEDIKINVIEI